MQAEYITDGPEMQEGPEILHDISPSGRERPWRQWKLESELLAEAYWSAAAQAEDEDEAREWARRSDLVRNCATHPTFERHITPEGASLTLQSANLCKDRLCPLCQWRRSLKMAAQARAVVAEVDRRKIARDGTAYAWLLLTLTQRNVPGPCLGAELDTIHGAFRRLTATAAWKDAIRGWLRVTEITRNNNYRSKWCGTYHPHVHALLAVPRRYFKSDAYIEQHDWALEWARLMRLHAPAVVDVRRVTQKGQIIEDTGTKRQSMGAAVAEVAKYAVKPGSYLLADDLDATVEAVTDLAAALAGRRMTAWGGVCKEAAQALRLDSLEGGDLVHIDETSSASVPADAISQYIAAHWAVGLRNYVIGSRYDAPASWAAAAAAAKERAELRPKMAAKLAADSESNRAMVDKMRAAVGPKIAERAIRAHDAYQIGVIMEVANHGKQPKTTQEDTQSGPPESTISGTP